MIAKIVQIISREWKDFITAAIYERNERIGTSSTIGDIFPNAQITIGRTYGRVIAISTYRSGIWYIQFFLPLGIIHTIATTFISKLFWGFDDEYYYSTEEGLYYYLYSLLTIFCIVLSTTAMIHGIVRIYAGKRIPPSCSDCLQRTVKSALPLLGMVITVGLPAMILLKILAFTRFAIDDILFQFSSSLFEFSVWFDFMMIFAFIYYCTLYTIIVIPCIIFEQIQNPIMAMIRSYHLTQGRRTVLVLITLVVLLVGLAVETVMDYLRYELNGEQHWLSKHLISSLTEIIFIPWFAILQTVIYCNISHVHEIRGNVVLPSASSFESPSASPAASPRFTFNTKSFTNTIPQSSPMQDTNYLRQKHY